MKRNIFDIIERYIYDEDRIEFFKKLYKILNVSPVIRSNTNTDIDVLNKFIQYLVRRIEDIIQKNDIPFVLDNVNKYYEGCINMFLDDNVYYSVDNPDGTNNPFFLTKYREFVTGNKAIDEFFDQYYADDINNIEDIISIYWELVDECLTSIAYPPYDI